MNLFNSKVRTSPNIRKKRRGSSRHYLLFFLTLVFLAGAGFGVYTLLSRLTWLNLQSIQVSGNSCLEDSLLINIAKPLLGKNLLTISKSELEASLTRFARVREARVSLRPPHSIKISIVERKGSLYVKSAEGDLFPIDDGGLVLEQFGNVYAEDLPIVGIHLANKDLKPGRKLKNNALQRILKVHGKIRDNAPGFLPQISEYYCVDNTVYIIDAKYGTRIIPGSDKLDKQLKRYQFVQDNGNIDRNSVVDLRYADQVVVRKGI